MNTLFDYVSTVNGIMYLISLVSIAGFILMWEIFSPQPFRRLIANVMEELRLLRELPKAQLLTMAKNIVMAPVYFAVYLLSMPFLFALGIVSPVGRRLASMGSFEWSPVRAYFRGRKKDKTKGGTRQQ